MCFRTANVSASVHSPANRKVRRDSTCGVERQIANAALSLHPAHSGNDASVDKSATRKRPRDDNEAKPHAAARSRCKDEAVFNTIKATIQQKYLQLILSGAKTVEGRIDAGMFANVRGGSKMLLFWGGTAAMCDVVEVTRHRSFGEMLEHHGFKACIPDARTLQEAVAIYNRIPGYRERAEKSGVLGIVLRNPQKCNAPQ